MKKFLTIIALALVAVLCIALVACEPTQQGGLEKYDMSGVTFADKSVVYDGTAKTITVAGNLPSGVTVSYEHFSGETKLEAAPVNVGTYKVVAKLTGDDAHKAVEDMTAKLTIEPATITVVLGATQKVVFNQYEDLDQTVTFTKNSNGTFTHEYDGIEYVIEILSSNVDVEDLEIAYYLDPDKVGGGFEDQVGNTIEKVGATIYVYVTLSEYADGYANYVPTMLTSLTVEKRLVEIATAADLELMRTEMTSIDADLRYNTRYVLVDDIDLNGAVWKTIGATNEGDSFIGEFDGNGKTISNFVINENSVTKEDILATNGTSFGFWGFLKDAYIHDVTFDDFEVSVDVNTLTENIPEYAFNGSFANPICFGILAGRTRFGSVIGTRFVNVTVTNADIYFKTYGGFYGTFIGEEYAGAGGADENPDKSQGTESEAGKNIIRKNLDASHVRIQAVEAPSNNFGRLSIGGLVGELMFDTHYYEDCDVSEIILVNGDANIHSQTFTGRGGPQQGYYTANVGGLIGLDYSTWQESKFTNCTISNYRIETWVNRTGAGVGVFYCGTMRSANGGDAYGSGVALVDCTESNGDDSDKPANEKYGLFKYYHDGSTWNLYEFDQVIDGTETELWIKSVGAADEPTNWVVQEGRYALNDDDVWEKYLYDSASDSWSKANA